MPAIMVKILFGEMGEELLLQGQKVVPAKMLASGFEFKYANLKVSPEEYPLITLHFCKTRQVTYF